MSLTIGTGPFARGRSTLTVPSPTGHVLYWEDWPRRMRAMVDGETVLDSRRGKVLFESDRFAAHFFPIEDFRADLLVPSNTADTDEFKGPSRRWHLVVGDATAHDAIIEYPSPPAGAPPLAGWAVLAFDAVDRWFEEDDPVYAHPKDPYHRVDVRSSSRRVVVRYDGRVVADSKRPQLLFETGLPIRYYLPPADVCVELLERSESVSKCPYKGDGQHWHLVTDHGRVQDACWSLPHPLPEGFAAAQHICFYPDKVDIEVDGQRVVEPEIF